MPINPLPNYIGRFETYLRTYFAKLDIPAKYIQDAMWYALESGGKRLRPLLVYLTGELVKAPIDALDVIALSTELIHSYSLIHDDLPAMDNDDVRRGKPSCHRAFDEATAILAGDALQALALECLLTELPKFITATQTITIGKLLSIASGPSGMVSGQSMDLRELCDVNMDVNKLTRIHQLKTGKLFTTCIEMALIAGKPAAHQTATLKHFAEIFGLVFQMQDDYLDAFGDVKTTGKNRSSDACNKKFTFATLYSKDELAALITEKFRQAEALLSKLDAGACGLVILLNEIAARTFKSR